MGSTSTSRVSCPSTPTGATFRDVMKINVYSTNMEAHVPMYGPIRSEYFEHQNVPSTYVEVSGLALPDAFLEIETIAILD